LWDILNPAFPNHIQLHNNILTMDTRILTRIHMPIILTINLIHTLSKPIRTLIHIPIINNT
jgi:hypothetical protein